jgi:hypothetical protein
MAPGKLNALVVHVHGNSGNFYENGFLDALVDEYRKAGLGFLVFNNRGHDVIAEAYRAGQLCYIGGAVERYSESVLDIQAAVDFAHQHAAIVYLQGHSFGCLKVLNFLIKCKQMINAVFISPADTIQLQRDFIHPETLEHQIARVTSTYGHSGLELLPSREFGIRELGCEYTIPITAKAFLDLFDGSFARLLSYRSPVEYHLDGAAFVYCGGSDPLLTSPLGEIEAFFSRRFQTVSFYIEKSGNHHMKGVEDHVAGKISGWISGMVTS